MIETRAPVVGRKDDRGFAFQPLVGCKQFQNPTQAHVDRLDRVVVARAPPGPGVAGRVGVVQMQEACS